MHYRHDAKVSTNPKIREGELLVKAKEDGKPGIQNHGGSVTKRSTKNSPSVRMTQPPWNSSVGSWQPIRIGFTRRNYSRRMSANRPKGTTSFTSPITTNKSSIRSKSNTGLGRARPKDTPVAKSLTQSNAGRQTRPGVSPITTMKPNSPPGFTDLHFTSQRKTVKKPKQSAPIDVGLEAEKVKTELRIIYRTHAPVMLLKLSQVMSRFRGREQQLLSKVKEKYAC